MPRFVAGRSELDRDTGKVALGRRAVILSSVAGLSGLAACAIATVPQGDAIAGRYGDRPAMMAIGDSMYQGVRSLSFTAELARHSPPMQTAAALQLPMVAPDPPRSILFDLEARLRSGGIAAFVAELRELCLANMQSWLSDGVWSRHEAFDNVAVGGAEISSLYTDTYATSWTVVQASVAKLRQNLLLDIAAVGNLWFALNTCFTLNPRRREEQASKTQLDQVGDRKPKLLLVNIGSNEGLFRAAFLGAFDPATMASVAAIPKKMEALAERLAALPREVETIAINSLVRPRAVPNLMPSAEAASRYPGDGYFAAYGPWIISSTPDLSGSSVRDFDQLTAEVNDQVHTMLSRRLGARLRFVDLFAASSLWDGKHYSDRGIVVQSRGGAHLRLTNVPTLRKPLAPEAFVGGLAGLDNMHPTVPGYAVIADAVLEALGSPVRTDKDAAFAADTLLNDLPFFVPISHLELTLLGQFGAFRNLTA